MKNILLLVLFIWVSRVRLVLGKVLSCRSSHLNGTLGGYHCPNDDDLISNIAGTERWQYSLLCMRHPDCVRMEHIEAENQCRLAKGLCYEAEDRRNVKMRALGPPRLGCVEWRPSGTTWQPNLIKVNEVGAAGNDYALDRFLIDGYLLPVFSGYHTFFKSTTHSLLRSSTIGEYIFVNPGCPILWVPWNGTSGVDLPKGALVGGHLAEGSDVYIAKAWVANTFSRLGYYNPVTGRGYFWSVVIYETSQVSLLALL